MSIDFRDVAAFRWHVMSRVSRDSPLSLATFTSRVSRDRASRCLVQRAAGPLGSCRASATPWRGFGRWYRVHPVVPREPVSAGLLDQRIHPNPATQIQPHPISAPREASDENHDASGMARRISARIENPTSFFCAGEPASRGKRATPPQQFPVIRFKHSGCSLSSSPPRA